MAMYIFVKLRKPPVSCRCAAPGQGYASAFGYEVTWCEAANSVARVVVMDPFRVKKKFGPGRGTLGF